jgi:hypothetical protein
LLPLPSPQAEPGGRNLPNRIFSIRSRCSYIRWAYIKTLFRSQGCNKVLQLAKVNCRSLRNTLSGEWASHASQIYTNSAATFAENLPYRSSVRRMAGRKKNFLSFLIVLRISCYARSIGNNKKKRDRKSATAWSGSLSFANYLAYCCSDYPAHYRSCNALDGLPGRDFGRTMPTQHTFTLDLQPVRRISSTEVRRIICKATALSSAKPETQRPTTNNSTKATTNNSSPYRSSTPNTAENTEPLSGQSYT